MAKRILCRSEDCDLKGWTDDGGDARRILEVYNSDILNSGYLESTSTKMVVETKIIKALNA